MKIATTSLVSSYDKKANLNCILNYIDEAAANGADLVLFPEQFLSGYLQSLVAMPFSDFEYQYTNAEVIPEGESVQAVIKKAMEKKIYVAFGMTERDDKIEYKMYNSVCFVGPEGYIGKYRKVHLPADEVHIYTAGTSFPVFDTPIGKIGICICYDKQFPESCREMALGGAEIILHPTAWPINNPTDEIKADIKKDLMYKIYTTYETSRAMENQCLFVSSNQIGKTGDIEYLGCSTITDAFGEQLATTGYSEGIVYAEIDLKKAIFEYKTVQMLGLNLVKDRNINAYKRILGEKETIYSVDKDQNLPSDC